MNRPKHGGNLAWAACVSGCSPIDILDFSASINPLGPPQSAIAAIQAHLADLNAYPDPSYSRLRQCLSQTHRLAPDWVLPGNGAAELLTWASRELAELDAVYVITPAFGDYGRSLKAFNANLLTLPMTLDCTSDWELEIRQWIASHDHQSRACGLMINTPHNPTGRLVSTQTIRQCLDHFALVVIDEAFIDFLPPDRPQSVVDWVEEYPNLVVLRSLTKFYSVPGLRIGYAVAHPDRLCRWQQWRDAWAGNVLAEAAAIAVLSDLEFQRQTWAWLPPARSHLFEGLSDLPGLMPYPGVANFLLVRCLPSVLKVQKALLKQHQILIRDCLSFAELGDRYFRVAVRLKSDHDRLLDGLRSTLKSV
ncbi:MAG TPA: threonine-phosphate decarboxylase CobD [Elainellaceae cyanobacterium]